MHAEFLEAQVVQQRLKQYMDHYDEFHWAVAWGTGVDLLEQLFGHRAKFTNVTFGVAFSQTDPAVVDALVGVANGYIATKFKGGTYHPKVYGFRSGKQVAAIVGGANFTHGGLGKNFEAAVALTGTIDDPALANILAFARTSARYGQEVTQPYADAYRASYVRAARLPKPPRDPVQTARIGAAGKVMAMNWGRILAPGAIVWTSQCNEESGADCGCATLVRHGSVVRELLARAAQGHRWDPRQVSEVRFGPGTGMGLVWVDGCRGRLRESRCGQRSITRQGA